MLVMKRQYNPLRLLSPRFPAMLEVAEGKAESCREYPQKKPRTNNDAIRQRALLQQISCANTT